MRGRRGDDRRGTARRRATIAQQFAGLFTAADYRFELRSAADYRVAGSNIDRWIDANNSARWLQQATSANQPLIPTADASLGGALSMNFTSATPFFLDSNEAASAWNFLSNGSGATVYVVGVPGAFAAADYLFATADGSTQGMDCYRNGASSWNARVVTGSADQIVVSGVAAGTPTYLEFTSSTAGGVTGRLKNGTATTHALSSTTGAEVTLRLGARPVSGALGSNIRINSFLLFKRVLTTAEKSLVQAYILSKTGIVP